MASVLLRKIQLSFRRFPRWIWKCLIQIISVIHGRYKYQRAACALSENCLVNLRPLPHCFTWYLISVLWWFDQKKRKKWTWKLVTCAEKGCHFWPKMDIIDLVWPPFSVWFMYSCKDSNTATNPPNSCHLVIFIASCSRWKAMIDWYCEYIMMFLFFIASPQSNPPTCSISGINLISTRETQTNGTRAFAKQLLQRKSKNAWKFKKSWKHIVYKHKLIFLLRWFLLHLQFLTSNTPNAFTEHQTTLVELDTLCNFCIPATIESLPPTSSPHGLGFLGVIRSWFV